MKQKRSFYLNSTISINICTYKNNFNNSKLRYTDTYNFSPYVHWWANKTRWGLLRTFKFSPYLNLSIPLPTNIFPIIKYTSNMIVPHKWTQMLWSALPNCFFRYFLLPIIRAVCICEGHTCRVRISQCVKWARWYSAQGPMFTKLHRLVGIGIPFANLGRSHEGWENVFLAHWGRHFAYGIFTFIFMKGDYFVLIHISLNAPIDSSFSMIIIWRWTDGRPLSEVMTTYSLAHVFVIPAQTPFHVLYWPWQYVRFADEWQ